MRKPERAVVHGDHPACTQVDEGFGGVFGASVDVAEAFGRVSADGEQGHSGRQALADLTEACEVGGVAGVIEGILTRAENISTVAAVGIFENAGAPVARGHVRDFEVAWLVIAPPIEFY